MRAPGGASPARRSSPRRARRRRAPPPPIPSPSPAVQPRRSASRRVRIARPSPSPLVRHPACHHTRGRRRRRRRRGESNNAGHPGRQRHARAPITWAATATSGPPARASIASRPEGGASPPTSARRRTPCPRSPAWSPGSSARPTRCWPIPRGQDHNFPVAVDDHTPVLADLFRAAGEPVRIEHGRYIGGGTLTASFDNLANFANHPKWFVRGYEYHVSVTPGTQRMVGAEVLHRRLFPWLAQHAGEDFFLFVHYWDVHGPYLAPAPFGAEYPRPAGGRRRPRAPRRRGRRLRPRLGPGGRDDARGAGPDRRLRRRDRLLRPHVRPAARPPGRAWGSGSGPSWPSPPTTGRAWPSTACPSPTTSSTTPPCTSP